MPHLARTNVGVQRRTDGNPTALRQASHRREDRAKSKAVSRAAVINELADRARERGDWLERLEAARRWSDSFARADIETTREISLQGTFLQRVFVDVLGYLDQGSGLPTWSLTAHPQTEINSRIPDGTLGIFRSGPEPLTHAVIELKDALTDIDAKQLQREDRLSPVEQAFLYLASYENASFAIVSNFRVLRLYTRRYGMVRFHEFDLTRLYDSDEVARLIGVCGSESLIASEPGGTPPLMGHLLDSPPRAQRDITAALYESYSVIRDRLVGHVHENHPHLGADSVHVVQKLLDRALFVAYAEDVGLLPATILRKTIDHGLTSRSRSSTKAWDELRYLFQDIDRGRSDLTPAINRYNGGLFANDPVLDEGVSVPDELVAELKTITSFDFKSEVDVNILGHVFENSIADIETLRRSISLDPHFIERDLPAVDQHRRDLGVFYTHKWVTGFIGDETLGRTLQQSGSSVRRQLRILDPACGSGAFLSEALSYLADHSRALAAAGMAAGELDLFSELSAERPSDYLTQLFGIDLMYESVEIAKLSLWLKSADRSRPLGGVDGVLRGNSLVAPDEADGYGASPIASVIAEGGFDVVVGNPPWGSQIDYDLDPAFRLSSGQFDSYELFTERALSTFLAEGGYFGFIVNRPGIGDCSNL